MYTLDISFVRARLILNHQSHSSNIFVHLYSAMYPLVASMMLVALLFHNFTREYNINQQMYVPIHSLRKADICSIVSIALTPTHNAEWKRRVDTHHSRRTMLYVLLSIKMTRHNERLLQWIYDCHPISAWSIVERNYYDLKNVIEPYQMDNKADQPGKYWELKVPTHKTGPRKSREYTLRYRSGGFQANELKIYWNYPELRDLIVSDHYNEITDFYTHVTLLNHPVVRRMNQGEIEFVASGIQDAVFQVPNGKQVIVLDFANERIPGGYFLENAMAQEEAILYNSDAYRALLDLKYTMMDGGYMLPEYGVAYVNNVRFFRANSTEGRLTDLIIGACYDLSAQNLGLYRPPSSEDYVQIRNRTLQKFQTIIASAVANTIRNGENTYLLLGPIGTGVFRNNKKMIAELFSEVLNNPLMNSVRAIRYAFDRIWFVSTESLPIFQEVLQKV